MPPPPPPAPPPLPKQSAAASNSRAKSSDPPPDRNALLSQIRKGAALKKVEAINDRSAPLISNKPSGAGTAPTRSNNKSNGPVPLIPPGGLFAQGIPKLRPTTPKTESNLNPPASSVIQSIKQQGSANSTLRVAQLSKSRSQPPSPVSKPRSAAADRLEAVLSSRIANSSCSDNSSTPAGNPNFPDDVTIKGPAPAPPPQSQKPTFNRSTTDLDPSAKHSTVKRSASQTNLQRPRFTRPPNEKPPPPPKSTPAPPTSAPPPPPSKPPNIMRRQSFGVGEGSRFAANKQLSLANSTPKPSAKNLGPPPPPPPPRNNSAPNDLNNMVQSSPGNGLTKMNIAPPPPPNRAPAAGVRSAPVRPPPPRAPAPPPPPPQHHAPMHPAPPSQLKAVPHSPSLAPPPPARVSSMKQAGSDFEDRFKSMFSPANSLPKPEKFTNFAKTYPSKAAKQKQSVRRQPPPPPPNCGNRGQQFDSGFQSGNFNHSLNTVKPTYAKEIFNPNL